MIGYMIVLFLIAIPLISILVKDSIKERKLNKKIKSIRIGQKFEENCYHENPFTRGRHIVTVTEIKDGYILYKDKD